MKGILTLALVLLLSLSFAAPAHALETEADAARLCQGRGKDAVESSHPSLQDAFDSVTRNGAVITLLRDVTESVEYNRAFNATLYFNGHTLTGLDGAALSHTGRGALTLGELGGTGGGIVGDRYALYISSTRDTLLQSGAYTADAAYGTAIYNAGGSLSIRYAGGALTAQGAVALRDDSARLLQITGGRYQATGKGFAVLKTRGNLNLTGEPIIQGEGGGLLLEPGPDMANVTQPRNSALFLEAGALIAATAPGGVALQIKAEPLWDVTVGKSGALRGDTALALAAGNTTITGPDTRVEGRILATGGLCLQGGFYSLPPGPPLLAPGLFAAKGDGDWYALVTEPPAPSPSPVATVGPTPGGEALEPSPTPVSSPAAIESPAPTERQGGPVPVSGATVEPPELPPAQDGAMAGGLPAGGVGVPKSGATGWAGGWLMLAAAGLGGLLLRQTRK